MELTEDQQLLAENTKKAQENNVNQDNELATGLFYYQVQQQLMTQQACAYYDYLVLQDQLLQQHYMWQLQLQAQQVVADRYASQTSFLHRQENSFLTPWSRNSNVEGEYVLGVDGRLCMMFKPGSFFSTGES